jgi:hypothetical protein
MEDVSTTNPHPHSGGIKEKKSDTRFYQYQENNSRGLTSVCSAGTPSVLGQESNISSICCSSGEFLLHFIKVMLIVIYVTKDYRHLCYSCIAAADSAALAVCVAAVCRTNSSWSSLYNFLYA